MGFKSFLTAIVNEISLDEIKHAISLKDKPVNTGNPYEDYMKLFRNTEYDNTQKYPPNTLFKLSDYAYVKRDYGKLKNYVYLIKINKKVLDGSEVVGTLYIIDNTNKVKTKLIPIVK